ncbi:Pkinase-domain-containing protein [Auriscalpium vulgare]|uniref:Pkinase-domain-containing protein n=1 Tax=Auriscalpium vulgare TaxID=40419 RepID=A0ACB8S368_9AGAM|nr:Pkinase-domain-containing protein [Auriscalpium vulgare]
MPSDPVAAQDPSKKEKGRGRSPAGGEGSSSPAASPSSFIVARGRSRARKVPDDANPFSEENLRRRGYHSLRSFDKTFHVEKRWKLVREMGSGAYGVVISAADDISGETVAIKMVTRVFDKPSLAKRALRELTLLRHFSNHENITGLIDVDAIADSFNEMYLFMEPMEADLHQIIKSGQMLTSEHVQYFTYQILRGMKYVHSASVVHRDLKPGNLLVNSDCELKICDFGLSRGFDSAPDEGASQMTEYVATRWYRAPEIMLAFKRYSTAIDVWSIGCILAELLLGRPLFKGKDYVDQLNKILEVLGSPRDDVLKRMGSERAQAYVRGLPFKKKAPFKKIIPHADTQALDLLEKMLDFDPFTRITVTQALEHPWLAAYHDVQDEPDCPTTFDRWREIEKLETIEDFRKALWTEIEDYRREVRAIGLEWEEQPGPLRSPSMLSADSTTGSDAVSGVAPDAVSLGEQLSTSPFADRYSISPDKERRGSVDDRSRPIARARDPLVSYARRASVFSTYSARESVIGASASVSASATGTGTGTTPTGTPETATLTREPSFIEAPALPVDGLPAGSGAFPFPSMTMRDGYVLPARSRTASMAGPEMSRKLLRTLSTVSIYESVPPDVLRAALADEGAPPEGVAPIARYIREKDTAADAPASEMPGELGGEGARWDGARKS